MHNFLIEKEIKGHTFTVLDPVSMPVERIKAFQLEEYALRKWGCSGAQLKSFVDKVVSSSKVAPDQDMMSYFGKIDEARVDVLQAALTMQEVIDRELKYIPYMNGAMIAILIDDEPVYPITAKYIEQKQKLIALPEIEGFFLDVILSLWHPTADKSTTSNLLDSLRMEVETMTISPNFNFLTSKTTTT